MNNSSREEEKQLASFTSMPRASELPPKLVAATSTGLVQAMKYDLSLSTTNPNLHDHDLT
jgi:hypothetical protein